MRDPVVIELENAIRNEQDEELKQLLIATLGSYVTKQTLDEEREGESGG